MHGAGGGAPKGNRNALKHGLYTAETLAVKKQIGALARMARETMAAVAANSSMGIWLPEPAKAGVTRM